MIKPELYHKTVDILYQAYFNETLQHYNCYACAVGNLIAANCGYSFKKADTIDPHHTLFWDHKIVSVYEDGVGLESDKDIWFNAIYCGEVDTMLLTNKIKEEVRKTGYSSKELALIEEGFELADLGNNSEDHMFNGLAAVLEVLKQIHQITDEDEINNTRFEQHYKKRVEKCAV